MKSYKEFMATQGDIRKDMLSILRKNPSPIATLAKDINISPISLKKFLIEEIDVDFTRFCRIDSWVIELREKS